MNMLFWQELFLILVAVIVGMMLGCYLRRAFSSSAETGSTAKTASGSLAASAAAGGAVSLASDKGEAMDQAEADRLVAETNGKLAAQETDDAAKADDQAEEKSKAEKSEKDSDDRDEADLNADGDVDQEEERIAAAIAALPDDASDEQKADVAGKRPETLTAPRDGEGDDLKRIKGIGKVIEGKLHNLGIYHFDQIADWGRDEVNWVTTFLSFKGRIDREEWIPQAQGLMAEGDDAAEKAAAEAKAKEEADTKAKEEAEAKAAADAKAKEEAEAKAAADAKAKEEAKAKAAADAKAKKEAEAKGVAEEQEDPAAEEARIAAAIADLPSDASVEDKANAAGSKPNLLDGPRNGEADDLKRIKGVGKVIEGKLNNLGIYHFDQIAKWSRKEVNWVTTFLSFKGRVDRENWIEQAKLLASGEETEFSKKVDKGSVYD